MLDIQGPHYRSCDGVSRRGFLRAGFLGLGGLTLANSLRAKDAAKKEGKPTRDTAVILLCTRASRSRSWWGDERRIRDATRSVGARSALRRG